MYWNRPKCTRMHRWWRVAHLCGFCKGGIEAECAAVTGLPWMNDYSAKVCSHPQRYYGTNHPHFITCSCYPRQPWLGSRRRRDLFLSVLEEVRQRYNFVVVG